MADVIRAPFPWFGGKATVAAEVWARLGDVANYVEPFFGSGAALLNRPAPFSGPETINDKDQFVSNFWRAVAADPEAVAHHADWPVNEADLAARHYWLLTDGAAALAPLMGTPDGYDAKIAGWWVWGLCSWIGSGWCSGEGPWAWVADEWRKLPHLGNAGMGINRQLPHLGDAGRGINRQLPHLGNAGRGGYILAQMTALYDRLRGVRVACGDWARVCGSSVTTKHGLTAVFLDPPYGDGALDYSVGGNATGDIAGAAAEWAITNGSDPLLRIAFCGYEGNHQFPADWECFEWKARGGFGSQGDGDGRANSARERIWFSPGCIRQEQPRQIGLFAELEAS